MRLGQCCMWHALYTTSYVFRSWDAAVCHGRVASFCHQNQKACTRDLFILKFALCVISLPSLYTCTHAHTHSLLHMHKLTCMCMAYLHMYTHTFYTTLSFELHCYDWQCHPKTEYVVCNMSALPFYSPSLFSQLLSSSPLSPLLPPTLVHLLTHLVYSARLRQALGIGPTSLPPYISRMCVLGYPPGYSLQEKEQGLLLYDSPDSPDTGQLDLQ